MFTSTDWEEDISFVPTEPFIVRQGEGLRFECAFHNTTQADLRFGDLANDEMCILYGNVVSTAARNVGPQDCVLLSSPPGQVTRGFPCAQCPDGE